MPKVNPFTLPMPTKPEPETRTFTDPRHPGLQFTLTLRVSSGILEDMTTDALASQYTETYCNPDSPILMSDGQGGVTRFDPTPPMMNMIARLERAEVCAEGEEKYAPGEWLQLAYRAPDAFAGMTVFWQDLRDKERSRFAKKEGDEGGPDTTETLMLGAEPVFPTLAGGG